jgi:hypothetical protein
MEHKMRLLPACNDAVIRPTFRSVALAAALGVGLLTLPAGHLAAQTKELSDKSVELLISYAWAITPPKFTTPTGKTIEVDKSKRDQVVVPIDVAREVVKVGRLSASAQMCGLVEEQAGNYQTMMAREQAKNKWSDQQLLFISQLHLFTVMMMTGGVKVVQKEGDKEVVVEANKLERPKADVCNEAERGKVKERLAAYRDTAPPATKGAAANSTKKE